MKSIMHAVLLMAWTGSLAQAQPISLGAPPPVAGAAAENEAHGEAPPLKSPRSPYQRPAGISPRQANAIFSSLDEPKASEKKEVDAHAISLMDADLEDVLDLYQDLSGRSVVRSINLQPVRINFRNETALSRREALQTLDTALASSGVAMILSGPRNIKAVSLKEAPMEAGPIIDWLPEKLPDCGTFIVYVLHVREDQSPRELAPVLQPFARIPNSILAIDSARTLVLRDFSANIRQMLQMIDRLGPMQPNPNQPPRPGPQRKIQ